ncbi:MAG: hypothetical protein A2V70_20290 [Planctomycetes bacterium RBG_13_63_9]|nr:MAG: hypothetical protein A2V70_20290 [Planctomycetes bacterium RBG_13_63_9]
MSLQTPQPTEEQYATQTSRRSLLALGWTGAGVALGTWVWCRGERPRTVRILRRGDRTDIDGKGREIIERTYRLGYDYEARHGG